MKKIAAFITGALLMTGASLIPTVAAADPNDDLQAARAASARYHSINQALEDGYVAPPACTSHPTLGAMGYHFENHSLMEDDVLDVTQPEILIYERKENGRFSLVAIEFYIEADQTTTRPALFGQAFDGPMPAHHPGMEQHYDLHVWLWKENPRGLFSAWNPDVVCP